MTLEPADLPKPAHVVAVILNTNRRADTLACLESLARSQAPRPGILVLDNASTDGSVEAIRAKYPDVEIHPLAQNLGYAGNNNVGIRRALAMGADWVLLLNEDVVVGADALRVMLEAAGSRANAGFVGPMVYHYDEPEIIQSAGGRLGPGWQAIHVGQNSVDRGEFASPRSVQWVSGCALLARREMIESVGVLDERFFYYWEETEWCLRARGLGWDVLFVPGARAWHKGVQRDYQPSPNVTYYWARNWLMMLAKHRAPVLVWLVAIIVLGRSLLSWSIRPRWRSRRPHRDALWQGVVDFLRGRSGIRPPSPGALNP